MTAATKGSAEPLPRQATEAEESTPRARMWLWFLVAGLLATAVSAVLPARSDALGAVYLGINAGTLWALFAGIRMNRPGRPLPWCFLGAGTALLSVANVIWVFSQIEMISLLPFPSIADWLYIPAYALIVIGVALLGRRQRRRDRGGLLDAAMVTAGLGVVAWVFLLYPNLEQAAPPLAKLVALAYPSIDLVLLGAGATLAFALRKRTAAFWLLILYVGAQLLTDTAYGVSLLHGTFSFGGFPSAGWVLSYVFLGAAALHPTMGTLAEAEEESQTEEEERLSSRRYRAFLLSVALLAPAVDMIAADPSERVEHIGIAVASGTLFVLALARMTGLTTALRRVAAARRRALDGTLMAIERERTRIATELHDGPIQSLSALGYVLERVRLRLLAGDTSAGGDLLSALQRGLSSEIQSLRQLMTALRPAALDERGLEPAIHDQARALLEEQGVACRIDVDPLPDLPRGLETTLFRVAQEALRNIDQHARASHAWVTLRVRGDRVLLSVADDGRGIEPPLAQSLNNGHLGVAGMRARVEMAGGTFDLRSCPSRGTVVRASLPLERPAS